MFNVHCSMFISHWKVVDYPPFKTKEAQPMKLTAIRSLVAILAVFAIMAVCANAQQDFSNVQVKTNKISNNFYTLDGQGGTIGLLVGPDGVFMVDAQFAPLHDKIMAAIRQITKSPVKFVVNTHVHGDHTGGNEAMGTEGATILDRGNGGGLNGMINGLGQIIARSGPNTKIIPGHGPTVDRNAIIAHRDMMLGVRDRISKMIKDGKSEADVVAAKPWADFDTKIPQSDAKVGNTQVTVAQRFATQVYAELRPTR